MKFRAKNQAQKNDDLRTGVGVSFAFHAFLISLFTLKAVFFTTESIEVADAVRVDIIDLPDKIDPNKVADQIEAKPKPQEEPKPPEPQQEKQEQKPAKADPVKAKDLEAINLDRTKIKNEDKDKKLKAKLAIEKIKKDLDKSNKEDQEAKNLAAQSVKKFKGNVIAAGNSLTGLDRLQHEAYISSLDKGIKQNWYLPEWLRKKGLKTIITVKISEAGKVLSRVIITSSGNNEYDDSGIEAVDKAAPFDPPPEKFIEHLQVLGFNVEFSEK